MHKGSQKFIKGSLIFRNTRVYRLLQYKSDFDHELYKQTMRKWFAENNKID